MRATSFFRPTSLVATSLLLLAGGALGACGGGDGDDDDDNEAVDAGPGAPLTYYQDLKPLLDAKCGNCHVAGGIGPFGLGSYEEAVAHAGVASLAIEEGSMPPWHPNPDCNDYVGDRSLSADQKQQFAQWIADGMLEGDASNEAEPMQIDMPTLSRVDLNLEMETSYTPSIAPDDYRCFVVEWPAEFDTDTFVTGFSATPGNAKIAHHVIAFLAEPGQRAEYQQLDANEAGPGYTCFGGTGGPAQSWVGSWVPGTLGSDFPTGTGIRIKPGATIILQVHYNIQAGNTEQDTTSLQFRLADTVEKEAAILPWANPQWLNGSMPIGAGESDVSHSFGFSPVTALNFLGATSADSIQVYAGGLHMHTLGKSAALTVGRSGGGEDCMVQIDDWDFQWQGAYGLKEPMTIQSGDTLNLECHWDNSPTNQPVVEGTPLPPKDVNWGEGTGDEMCLGGVYWTE